MPVVPVLSAFHPRKFHVSQDLATPAASPGGASRKRTVVVLLLALLALGGAAAGIWFIQRPATDASAQTPAARINHAAAAAAPPVFLPIDTMLVNLADVGGERFAQVGINLELANEEVAQQIKRHMPSIRSDLLMLLSQCASEQLLTRQGKERLAREVWREVLRPLGYVVPLGAQTPGEPLPEQEADEDSEPPRWGQGPVRRVLFSSFIIQ